jgi:trimethylamine:corrinoid methyltransferase-like protein
MPRVADRLTYPQWTEQGKKAALDYARERMCEILAQPEKTYLTPSQEEDVERVLREAREYYRQRDQL